MTTTDASPAARPDAAVTTTDALKVLAVVAMIIDHYGHFLAADEVGWRVVGRLAAPIFFFLIGFAKSRQVPVSWWALGAALTALDFAAAPEPGQRLVNILIVFALIRLALGWTEQWLSADPRRPFAALAALGLLAPFAGGGVEYGAQGPMLALLGFMARRAVEAETGARPPILLWAAAALALGVHAAVEARDMDFAGLWLALHLALQGALAAALVNFRRRELDCPVVRALGAGGRAAVRFCGRWSLEIYAVHLAALYALALAGLLSD